MRVFNQQIILHARHEPGKLSMHAAQIAPKKMHGIERGVEHLMPKIRLIGSAVTAWAEAMLMACGIEGTRVLLGLIALTKKHAVGIQNHRSRVSRGVVPGRIQRERHSPAGLETAGNVPGHAPVPGRASVDSPLGRLRPGRCQRLAEKVGPHCDAGQVQRVFDAAGPFRGAFAEA
jgi:hypothetical protein